MTRLTPQERRVDKLVQVTEAIRDAGWRSFNDFQLAFDMEETVHNCLLLVNLRETLTEASNDRVERMRVSPFTYSDTKFSNGKRPLETPRQSLDTHRTLAQDPPRGYVEVLAQDYCDPCWLYCPALS